MKIYIVRHTSVDVEEGTCYGQTNVPLRNSFEEEAEQVKKQLENISFDYVCSSSLSRCTKLAKYCGYENIRLYDRLREFHFGDWEMKKWDDLDMSVWEEDWVNNPAPNGESYVEMYNRVATLFEDLKETNYKKILIFAHAGVISCARAYLEEVSLDKSFDVPSKYGQILEFDWQ